LLKVSPNSASFEFWWLPRSRAVRAEISSEFAGKVMVTIFASLGAIETSPDYEVPEIGRAAL
jgi:hypothetical protein